MHAFLRILASQHLSRPIRYGLPILVVILATLLRLVAPLDTAPFLLYLPLIFLASLALGRGPGFLGVAASALAAAYFFYTDDEGWALQTGEIIALAQYLVVGAVMVLICDALRRAIIESELSLEKLNAMNDALLEGQASLEAAKQEAEDAREAAESANRAKSSFLANMSHELRTPLSAVIGYSEMLEEEVEEMGEAGLLGDLGKIKANAKHLLSLINDVLDLSKVEAEKMDVYAEDIDVADFVRDAAATVDALIERKGNALHLDVSDDAGRMVSDAVKLRQCLFNLLSNAAKFTENGSVTLRVRREAGSGGDWLTFAVEDTGLGMSEEQLARLFQRFTQADETTTRRFGGTGLGLALSRAFARLMGGDITVTSTEGRGTCFTLRVPAQLPKAQEALPASVAPHDQGTRGIVLVIDDEASQRELMTRFLERQGFAVRTAPDGAQGLELARALSPIAILLDVMMPGMDGWTVLHTLKADPALAAVPVVMVSFVADAALSTSLGAVDAVPKPVDWGRLMAVLDTVRPHEGDVLVVDDDPDMRTRLRTVLRKSGWVVREAGNGLEALEAVYQAPPSLILLDLTMPVMDGFAFLQRLRTIEGCADIPVVVLSAREISIAERQELSEADQILRKDETSLRDLAGELQRLKPAEEARSAG